MKNFPEWDEARVYAQEMANRHNLDVAIRRIREYSKTVYRVSFASRMDSDYERAEIVHPHQPL